MKQERLNEIRAALDYDDGRSLLDVVEMGDRPFITDLHRGRILKAFCGELLDYIDELTPVVDHVRLAVLHEEASQIEADCRNTNAFDLLDARNDELAKAMELVRRDK